MTLTARRPAAAGRPAAPPVRATAPSRLEILLVRGGAAVIGLHVADDNFLQPNPGTSAGDHLASGLIPLALLLAAAWIYPRLRPTARGATAVLVGLFGIVAGLEAWHHARTVGLSGDDFTGLLTVPVGAMLLALAPLTLWRGRRRDGGIARRWGRRGLLGVVAAAIGAFVVVPILFSYAFTHLARPDVPEPRLGVAHERVSFRTSDGLQLRGWYAPSRNGAAVIAFPGRKASTQSRARFLARHGYGVLLFDRRGEGASDGDPNSFGWDGDRDVKAAIRFLQARPDVDAGRIGGIGLSVGGELLLETAAETPALRAVVSEGAGNRSYREVRQLGGANFLAFLPMTAGVTVFSGHAPPPALGSLMPKLEQPALLIHGRTSQNGTERRYNRFYDQAGGPNVTRWEIPDSGHVGGMDAAPEEYERRVIGFLDRALL